MNSGNSNNVAPTPHQSLFPPPTPAQTMNYGNSNNIAPTPAQTFDQDQTPHRSYPDNYSPNKQNDQTSQLTLISSAGQSVLLVIVILLIVILLNRNPKNDSSSSIHELPEIKKEEGKVYTF